MYRLKNFIKFEEKRYYEEREEVSIRKYNQQKIVIFIIFFVFDYRIRVNDFSYGYYVYFLFLVIYFCLYNLIIEVVIIK